MDLIDKQMDKLLLKSIKYVQLKKFKQAEPCLQKYIDKSKKSFEALHLLARVYNQLGKSVLAMDYLEKAYLINNKNNQLNQLYAEYSFLFTSKKTCLSLVNTMLAGDPDNINLLTTKAKALLKHRDYNNALDVYDSLVLRSTDSGFLFGQASCKAGMGNWEAALSTIKTALDLSPSNSEICALYLKCLQTLSRYTKFVEYIVKNYQHLGQTIKEKNIALAYSFLNLLAADDDDIAAKFMALQKLLPSVPDEMWNLHIASICTPVFSSNKSINEYRGRYIAAIEKTGKIECGPHLANFRPTSHFYLSYNGLNNRSINEQLSDLYPVKNNIKLSVSANANVKKKMLVISDMLYDRHTISKLNLGLLAGLSNGAFDVTVWVPGVEKFTPVKQLKNVIKKVNVVSKDIELMISNVKKIKPDFIFYPEIGMSSLIYALANERLAPVQFTSWGHPDTTGIKNIDCFVSSNYLEPKNAEEHYSEKLICLSKLPSVYPPVDYEKASTSHIEGFEQQSKYITCLQSAFKFHPEFDEIIRAILEQNPKVKLYIISSRGSDLLMKRFKESGIDDERVITLPKMKNNDFLNVYSQATVVLDPIHFGGGNTVYEGMSLGIPIVTLPGEFMRGRVTYAAYKQMDFENLIAKSKEHYVELVNKLIQDDGFNKETRQKIVHKQHLLFDTTEIVQELEDKLLGLIDNVK
jgi:tetratricopeptide (TPR) repeat protein